MSHVIRIIGFVVAFTATYTCLHGCAGQHNPHVHPSKGPTHGGEYTAPVNHPDEVDCELQEDQTWECI